MGFEDPPPPAYDTLTQPAAAGLSCPACQKSGLAPDAKFCGLCGATVVAQPLQAAASGPRPGGLQREISLTEVLAEGEMNFGESRSPHPRSLSSGAQTRPRHRTNKLRPVRRREPLTRSAHPHRPQGHRCREVRPCVRSPGVPSDRSARPPSRPRARPSILIRLTCAGTRSSPLSACHLAYQRRSSCRAKTSRSASG